MDEHEDGLKTVRLAGKATETEEEGQTVYTYDEVLFTLEAGRTETVEDIQRDFEAWWIYGSQGNDAEPTVEERLAIIEEALMGIIG